MNYPEKKNIFQIGLIALFGFFVVVGVITLAIYKGPNSEVTLKTPITIWGPAFPNDAFSAVITMLGKEDKSFENVRYVTKNSQTLYSELLEAIATGNSPDLVIVNSRGLLMLKNKLIPISFVTLPKSVYVEAYVDGAKIFMFSDAVYAYPLLVDPLVLYWNKRLFANSAVAVVPKDWDTFVEITPRLSKIVGNTDLTQSAIAFGEFDNVLHAKEILSALFLQLGYSIVSEYDSVSFRNDFQQTNNNSKPDTAMEFFTSFSNPTKLVYSWNKTFDRSREAFSANKVAMYAGFVSEEKILEEINPNLDFGMSVWPQSNNTVSSVTFGNFHGIGILKASHNPAGALFVARKLSEKNTAKLISDLSGLPSVLNTVLNSYDPTDPNGKTKVQSAIIAQSWLEPAPVGDVDDLFRDAVNSVVARTVTPHAAVSRITRDLNVLLEQY